MGEYNKQNEGQDKSAFQQLGDNQGEGGQRDIKADIRGSEDAPEEEFVGQAKTGEQSFAKDGQGAGDRSDEKGWDEQQ
jgi:hypothetical protein